MLTSCTSSEEENTPYLRKFDYNITKIDGWRYIEGVRRGLEYTVILVSGKIMKPADIAKARERMTSKNWRQFLIKTLECVMVGATNHSSLNNSEIDFLKENLENCSVENQYFLGYFTCFVKKALHSKELNHKSFSKKCLAVSFIFSWFFCLYQFGVGLVDLIFCRNFVKTYAMHRA